jgi:hypothetical protein
MTKPRRPGPRLLGDIDPAYFGDPIAELRLFADCKTSEELRDVLRAEVDAEVKAMLTLLEDADAFDVIELMRLREFPPVPLLDVTWEGSALNVEIVAAMLLGRPSRKPNTITPRLETRPHEAISELHNRAQRLARLATYFHQFKGRLSDDPLAPLAAQYQSAVLYIRNLQYDTVRDAHERQLFDNPAVAGLMTEHLGYTYPDVIAVRDSMHKLGGDRMTKLRDNTADILMQYPDTPPSEVPAEAIAAFVDGMVPFVFLPADRAIITPADVATDCGLPESVATAVMGSYAQTFDETVPPARRVFDLLTGTNPFQATPLVSDGAGNYVETTDGVGLDSLRRIVEKALTPTKSWHRYDKKVRQVVSERLAVASLEKVMRAAPKATAFKYYAPTDNESHSLLNSACVDLNAVGKVVEGDGLFIVGDVAICLEVKGKSVSPQGRSGDVRRLWNDLKATIGDGCRQAARLQALIEENAGLWLGDGKWLDLADVREVRSIVALLDDVGPLGTSLGDHRETGLLPVDKTPWVTSVHDLETIAQICDRPSEFLLYLRRRADSEVATYYKASDELDLFMLFMNANLCVEADPDQLRIQHPTRPRVTSRDRKAHARDAVFTMVGDQCQQLNAWMQRHQLESEQPQPSKPTYRALPRILGLVDAVEAHGNGMIRFGADVFAMAEDAQQNLLDTIDKCVRRTQQDGQPHDGVASWDGAWGHPTVFIGTRPHSADLDPVQRRLTAYIRLKRHQLESDRSYGFIYDEDGRLELAMYFNSPVEENPALDALIDEAGLQPAINTRPVVPPSARRRTRRLRGKKKR